MQITEIVKLEDCFDGSRIREMATDWPITEEAVKILAELGELDYYPDFPTPYFKVTAGSFHLKGVVGKCRFKAIFENGPDDDEICAIVRSWNMMLQLDAPVAVPA